MTDEVNWSVKDKLIRSRYKNISNKILNRIDKEFNDKVVDLCGGQSMNRVHIPDEIRKIMDAVSKWK